MNCLLRWRARQTNQPTGASAHLCAQRYVRVNNTKTTKRSTHALPIKTYSALCFGSLCFALLAASTERIAAACTVQSAHTVCTRKRLLRLRRWPQSACARPGHNDPVGVPPLVVVLVCVCVCVCACVCVCVRVCSSRSCRSSCSLVGTC